MAIATAPHHQRQLIPIVEKPSIADAIVEALDGVLALVTLVGDIASNALLPGPDDYEEIDLAVRLWATRAGATIVEWGQRGSRGWLEGIEVKVDHRRILTLHTPEDHHRRNPDRLPAGIWRPSDATETE